MEKEEITMLVEATQDITINAWCKVYGKPGYEDSRIVLELFRQWAEEFEEWWQSDDVAREKDDYMFAVDRFTGRKVAEFLRKIERSKKPERDFLVRVTRTDIYGTLNVLVTARDEAEAREKIEDHWSNDDRFCDKLTNNLADGDLACEFWPRERLPEGDLFIDYTITD